MKSLLNKWNVALGSGLAVALTAVPAFAAAGDAPSFDASTLTPKLNDFGTALLAALVILIGAVLLIKVPFLVIRIAMKTVNKVFGGSKPAAA